MASFNFTFQSGMSLDQIIGFEMAGRAWGKHLNDNTTINIHVSMARSQDLPDGVIGGALPGFNSDYEIDDIGAALAQDSRSTDDRQAVYHLPTNGYRNPQINAFLENYSWQNDDLTLTNANVKALNLSNSHTTVDLDGFILMSDLAEYNVDWDYNYARTLPSDPNKLDFLSVAMHEIGHVLGYVSSPDRAQVADWRTDSETNHARLNTTTTLDLFRYSDWSRRYGAIDLAAGVSSYLSKDGGQSAIGHFARGKVDLGLGSDGLQTSHWDGQRSSGIMDPLLSLGERSAIETIDVQALDIIGYDRVSTGGVASLNYAELLNDAKISLANRLGISVDALEAVPWISAGFLSTSRFGDVLQMIEDSEIYARRRSGTSGRGGLWQELADAKDVFEVFHQKALFSSQGNNNSGETSLGSGIALSLQQTYGRLASTQDIPLTLTGSLDSDVLDGSTGGDWLGGLAQSDILNGSAGNDYLFGNGGADTLRGNGGDDQLFGGLGDDRLMGGHGNDGLVGGNGSDRLSGGLGSDVFMVEALDGIDRVYDFTDGEDLLSLAPTLSFDQLTILDSNEVNLGALGIDLPTGQSHTVISQGEIPLMVLQNVDSGLITEADIV